MLRTCRFPGLGSSDACEPGREEEKVAAWQSTPGGLFLSLGSGSSRSAGSSGEGGRARQQAVPLVRGRQRSAAAPSPQRISGVASQQRLIIGQLA